MTTCRSCEAEVIFVPSSKTGRPMILNATPAKSVILVEPIGPLLIVRREVEGSAAAVVDVYTDHHATCPAAAEWKGKKR